MSMTKPAVEGKFAALTEDDVRDDEGEDEDCEEGQRQDEHVEEAVVPLPDAVAHPGAVVIESLCGERE